MAKRIIVKVPDPILTKKCREVDTFDERLWMLLDDLKDTVKSANGAGLAAPQVAVLKRVCVVDTEDGYFELINPIVKFKSGLQTGLEGCLSVPKKYGKVTRPMKITVIAKDRNGVDVKYKVSGFTARAFMHEIDHLDGIVYTSKATEIVDGD
ncbi:MAG: peptide deformylase [Bacteroides sp.]|nr:peptide deformylase [Bacillota bacterium]MCM1455659.1 peptide deformylase [Bacteroides sp.]